MDKLTSRQVGLLGFLAVLAPAVRLLPEACVLWAGKAAWVSPLLGLPLGLGYMLLMLRLSRRGLPGRVVPLLLALWLTLYGAYTARSAAERLTAALYPTVPPWVFTLCTLLAVLPLALGKRRTLGQLAELAAPVLVGVLLFAGAFLLAELNPANLLPLSLDDAPGIGRGILPTLELGAIPACFLLGRGSGAEEAGLKKRLLAAVGGAFLLFWAICILTVGRLSQELAGRLTNPLLTAVRNIAVSGVLERFESVLVSLWIAADLLLLGSLFQLAGHLIHRAAPGLTRPRASLGAVLCGAAPALLVKLDAEALGFLSGTAVPLANALFLFLLLPLFWLLGGTNSHP